MIFDTHAHIGDLKADNLSVPNDMTFLCVGYSHNSNVRAMDVCRKYDNVHPVLGIAPHSVQDVKDLSVLDEWINYIKQNKPVMIGEIGLDNHWATSVGHVTIQKQCFTQMLDLATELKLPISIHSRKAEQQIIDMLSSWDVKGIMHCFGGNVTQAIKCVDLGFMISVPPMKSNKRKKVIKKVGLDNIVVETDLPYIGKDFNDIKTSISIVSDVLVTLMLL